MVMWVHLVFDGADISARSTTWTLCLGSSMAACTASYWHHGADRVPVFRHISILVQEETGKPQHLEPAARIYLAAAELEAAQQEKEMRHRRGAGRRGLRLPNAGCSPGSSAAWS